MTKQQFMAELKQLLGELPADERDEALSYYEDYFADAGEGNEDRIIAELGSPEKVAYTIKSGLEDVDKTEGEFTENGFSGYESPYKDELVYKEVKSERRDFRNIVNNRNNLILFIIACVLLLPIIVPTLMTVLITIVVTLAALTFGLSVAGIATIVVGGLLTVIGITGVIASPMAGVIILGAAFVLLGFGSIMVTIGIKIASKLIPASIRIITRIGSSILNRFLPRTGGIDHE